MDQIHSEVAQELYAQYNIGRGRHGFTPFSNISTEDQNGWKSVAAHVEPVSETVTTADLEPNTEEAMGAGAVIVQDESGD